MTDDVKIGDDGLYRCAYSIDDPDFKQYHDKEWGRPVIDDRRLFEKICIEGFVSGLSFITLLKKRENFRTAFKNFDFKKVALFTEKDLDVLMENKGLIRNRKKLASVINNAQRMSEMVKEFGSLADFVWSFKTEKKDELNEITMETVKNPTQTKESSAMAKALKERGWSYVGPTNMYAMMQSVGVVNDHFTGCYCREECLLEMKQLTLLGT